MEKYYQDNNYINKVNDILKHKEFRKMENIIHHENNRLDHSIRVSYYSYLLAKFFRFDQEKVARAALLHDFFFEDNVSASKKKRIITMLKHPEYALENSKKFFEISELEEDIILSHMFPIGKHLPKFFESWLVDIVDDIVSICEKTTIIHRHLSTATCFLVMILVNNLR